MREIRFRRPHINRDGSFSHFSEWGPNLGNTSFTSPGSCNWAESAPDEQYTGLYDSENEPVIEGDLINAGYGIGKIIFREGCFFIEWIDDKEANIEPLGWTKNNRPRTGFIVFGNVHENPELLPTMIEEEKSK